jgi:hypothetical protein
LSWDIFTIQIKLTIKSCLDFKSNKLKVCEELNLDFEKKMKNFVFACLGIREIKIEAKMLCPHLKNLKNVPTSCANKHRPKLKTKLVLLIKCLII